MSLYKQDGSDIWWADINIPGHARLRRSTGETSRPEAQDIHDTFRAALRKADPALTGRTWGKAVEKWCKAETRSESELLSLLKFGRGFRDRKLSAVTATDIDKALSFCRTAGTHTRYLTMIGAILNLSDMRIKLIRRKDKKTKPRDWITREQWVKLYAELPKHMKPMAEFAIETGLRQANVLGLTWDHVDLTREIVWVEGMNTKAGKAIGVPLSEKAIHVLKSVQGQHPTFCFTFRGEPIKEIKTAFQAACIRSGAGRMEKMGGPIPQTGNVRYVGLTWHGLRHTWATWHVQNGTPLDVLQKLGSWSDLRMVMNYAHHSPGYLAGFANNTKEKS